MDSIGSDLVALNQINRERTGQYRFYSKILHPSEQAFYKRLLLPHLSFDYYLWLLWSVKESAYKALQRNNAQLVFSPTKIVVKEVNSGHLSAAGLPVCVTGYTVFEQQTLYFTSTITEAYIHTIAGSHFNFDSIIFEVQQIEQTGNEFQSAAVRTLVLNRLSAWLPGEDLQIIKHIAGYPQICATNQVLPVPLSFSHHGHYVAFAFDASALRLCKQI